MVAQQLKVAQGAPAGTRWWSWMGWSPPCLTHRHPPAVVVMCMHSALLGGEEQRVLLEKAEDMGMTDGTYVFIPYDALAFPLPYHHAPYPVLANNTKLRLAYDAVLTVTVDSPDVTFHEALQQAKEAYEIPAHVDPAQVGREASRGGSGAPPGGEGQICGVRDTSVGEGHIHGGEGQICGVRDTSVGEGHIHG